MTEVGEDALGLLTVKAAAALMSLGKRTVDRMIANDEIESFKIGRSRRIRRQAVDDYIKERLAASGHVAEGDAA